MHEHKIQYNIILIIIIIIIIVKRTKSQERNKEIVYKQI